VEYIYACQLRGEGKHSLNLFRETAFCSFTDGSTACALALTVFMSFLVTEPQTLYGGLCQWVFASSFAEVGISSILAKVFAKTIHN
jgi:hypothetical protein